MEPQRDADNLCSYTIYIPGGGSEPCGCLALEGCMFCQYHFEQRMGSPDSRLDDIPFSEDSSSVTYPSSPEIEVPPLEEVKPIPTKCRAPAGCKRNALPNGYCRTHRRLFKPLCSLSEKTLRGLLTRDFIARSTKTWNILSEDDMQQCWTATSSFRQCSFPDCPDPNYDPDSQSAMGDFYTINRRSRIYQKTGVEPILDWSEIEDQTKILLREEFPGIHELLLEFQGRIVAAGGAVFKALLEAHGDHDIDLFFIDPEIDRHDISDSDKTQKATQTLFEAVSYLADYWFKYGAAHKEYSCAVYVLRNDFVVSVYLYRNDIQCRKYQFILRVYPSVGHVLGGFDLGPAMIACDGVHILATELGAWSAMGRIMIADVSRRSTSFEHRLQKYAHYCHIVLPGLSRRTIPKQTEVWLSEEDVKKAIEELVDRHEHRWTVVNIQDCLNYDYRPYYDFVKTTVRYPEEIMKELLQKISRECGYVLEEVKLSPEKPGSLYFTDEGSEQDLKSLYDAIRDLSYKNGWTFDRDRYKRHRQCKAQLCTRIECKYLGRNRTILHLAMLDIAVDSPGGSTSGDWIIRPSKDPRIKYGFTDYYGDEMLIVEKGLTELKPSDYEDNPVWPIYSPCTNLSALLTGNLQAVTAMLCFKHSATTIPLGRENDTHIVDALQPSVFDIDLSDNALSADRRERIIELLKRGANEPNIGQVEELWNSRLASKVQGRSSEMFDKQLSILGKLDKDFSDLPDLEWRRALTEDVSPPILANIKANAEIAKKNLAGIKWILRNPGTQWTSSINPIIGNPREWYGEQYYRSWRIGAEEIETTLRLIRLRPGNPLYVLDRHIFRALVRDVIWGTSLLP
jgi:hypothetical protein